MAGKPKQQNESITISMDPVTLKRIDAHMKRREYNTRSAAVRDLIRAASEQKEAARG